MLILTLDGGLVDKPALCGDAPEGEAAKTHPDNRKGKHESGFASRKRTAEVPCYDRPRMGAPQETKNDQSGSKLVHSLGDGPHKEQEHLRFGALLSDDFHAHRSPAFLLPSVRRLENSDQDEGEAGIHKPEGNDLGRPAG